MNLCEDYPDETRLRISIEQLWSLDYYLKLAPAFDYRCYEFLPTEENRAITSYAEANSICNGIDRISVDEGVRCSGEGAWLTCIKGNCPEYRVDAEDIKIFKKALTSLEKSCIL